jgi:hypothetical protein
MDTDTEIKTANNIVRIAMAYCEAQNSVTGMEAPPVPDRQWQACCGVASRFLADPSAMTPQICHHAWRLSQMRHSHPACWPPAVATEWEHLSPTDRMLEGMGLRAMRDELRRIEAEEEERLIAHLHADAQQMQDAEIEAALDRMLRESGHE